MQKSWKRVQAVLAAGLVAGAAGYRPEPARAQTSDAPALAAPRGATAAQVIALAVRSEGKTPFKASRTQQTIRQDQVFHADAKVDFVNPQNYQIAVSAPKDINGLNLLLDNDKLTAFFPRENLLFQSDVNAGADEAKDLVLGKLTEEPALLARNYRVTLAPETDVVALYPCYRLELEPIRGLGPKSPPGRRIWVSTETGVVMKEERFWSKDMAAYFMSQYSTFSTRQTPTVKLNVPREASRLKLARGTATAMQRFASVEAARAAGKAIYAPTVVPEGFRLKSLDVMSLYGTDIVLMRYNDGLNNVVVSYRPKPNAFLTLMAGAFALSLVDKISKLAFHAPNNYAVIEKGDYLVYAYGDLWMDTLREVASTVTVPARSASR